MKWFTRDASTETPAAPAGPAVPSPTPAPVPATTAAALPMDLSLNDEPQEYKPSPKVAVVIAGAALAVTTGLTLLILPYARQASRQTAPPQFLSHANRSRVLRPNVPPSVEEAAFHAPLPSIVAANAEAGRLAEAAKVLKNQEDTLRVRAAEFAATAPREHAAWTIAGACSRDVARDVALTMRAEEAAEAVQKVREERVRVGVAEDAVEAVAAAEAEGEASHTPNLLSGMGIEEENELDAPRAAPVDPAKSPEFNDAEEDYHYGKPEYDEDGTAVQHVSAWLGLQALGIATAIVVGSAGLGVWGAAKYLGVSSMEEFAAKMRGSLEESYPELVDNVRRESDEPAPETPDLLDCKGIDIDDNKLRSWVKSWGYGDENK